MTIAYDDLPDVFDPPPMGHGSHWESTGGDEINPAVKHPIGFMRHKPRIRVKVWTAPILPRK